VEREPPLTSALVRYPHPCKPTPKQGTLYHATQEYQAHATTPNKPGSNCLSLAQIRFIRIIKDHEHSEPITAICHTCEFKNPTNSWRPCQTPRQKPRVTRSKNGSGESVSHSCIRVTRKTRTPANDTQRQLIVITVHPRSHTHTRARTHTHTHPYIHTL